MSAQRIQKVDILRYDPANDAEPHMQRFEVPFDELCRYWMRLAM